MPDRAARVLVVDSEPKVLGTVSSLLRQEGHEVTLVCYSGSGNPLRILPDDLDLVFISAFTEAAQTAYALSNFFRARRLFNSAYGCR